VPTAWLLITTLTAGVEKIFHSDPSIGFIALARKFNNAAAQGSVLARLSRSRKCSGSPSTTYLDAVVCGFFVVLVLAMCVFAVKICLQALRQAQPTAVETPALARVQGA
jgi:carbon starvation protein